MKTKVEINGYEIEIEERDGSIYVKAEKDEEIVEEFTIEMENGEEGEDQEDLDDVQGFEEFDGEEEDEFGGEEEGDEPSEEEEGDEVKLESFQSFVNKNKK